MTKGTKAVIMNSFLSSTTYNLPSALNDDVNYRSSHYTHSDASSVIL